ncbi:hypothetical protein GGI35DRAFT_463005 [Trichoderma velutinum]
MTNPHNSLAGAAWRGNYEITHASIPQQESLLSTTLQDLQLDPRDSAGTVAWISILRFAFAPLSFSLSPLPSHPPFSSLPLFSITHCYILLFPLRFYNVTVGRTLVWQITYALALCIYFFTLVNISLTININIAIQPHWIQFAPLTCSRAIHKHRGGGLSLVVNQ